jgi:oligosaccharide repeat unit polymerase
MYRQTSQIVPSLEEPATGRAPLVQAEEFALGNPLHGLIFTLAGLLFALMSLPADTVARGAVKWSAMILAVGIAVVPVVSAISRPKSIFRAEHIVVLSTIFWLLLDLLQSRYDLPGLDVYDIRIAFTAIACMVSAVWIGALMRPWGAPGFLKKAASLQLSNGVIFGTALIAFILAFLRFAIPSGFDLGLMVSSLGGGRWSAPWSRGDLGGADAFLDHFSYFGYILPALTVVLAQRIGWANFRTITIGCCALIIAAFLSQGGGRRIIGVMFGSAAILWFLGRPKIRLAAVFGLAIAGMALLTVLETMLDYRNVGFSSLLDPGANVDLTPSADEDDVLLRVDDNFLRLAQITAIFPEYHEHTTWHYALWVVARPIPRLFWPGKPLDPGFSLPEFLGREGVSYTSSVIGELYMAGGFIGVFLGGWLYGRLAGALSRLLMEQGSVSAMVIYSIGLLALFAGMRSMIELVLMSYGILAWAALLTLRRAPIQP